jgi:hypothetical protein
LAHFCYEDIIFEEIKITLHQPMKLVETSLAFLDHDLVALIDSRICCQTNLPAKPFSLFQSLLCLSSVSQKEWVLKTACTACL